MGTIIALRRVFDFLILEASLFGKGLSKKSFGSTTSEAAEHDSKEGDDDPANRTGLRRFEIPNQTMMLHQPFIGPLHYPPLW